MKQITRMRKAVCIMANEVKLNMYEWRMIFKLDEWLLNQIIQ